MVNILFKKILKDKEAHTIPFRSSSYRPFTRQFMDVTCPFRFSERLRRLLTLTTDNLGCNYTRPCPVKYLIRVKNLEKTVKIFLRTF